MVWTIGKLNKMAAILSTIEKQTPLENRTDLYRSTCSVYQPQLYFKNNFLLQDSTIPSLIEQSSFHRYLDYWWAFCIPLCFLLLIQILPFPYWLTGFLTGIAMVRSYFFISNFTYSILVYGIHYLTTCVQAILY